MKTGIRIAVCLIFLFSHFLSAQYSWQNHFPSLPAFSLPIELVHADNGTNRLFVAQQRGIIYLFENDPAVSTRKVFLNIANRVSQSGNELGLLGLAFHPHYPDSPYFYVNYTRTTDSLRSYITRYSVSLSNPDSALYDSEVILFTVGQPYSNHNGGKLEFGHDGYLYIGLGDGGSGNDPGNRAQNRTTLLGKILRINVDSVDAGLNYSIPSTNPYYNNSSGYRKEIFAYGIRNPWKFSFDHVKGTLWLGDVGQDLREEIDTVINGGNYGWRLMEGTFCTPAVNPGCNDTSGLLRPVYDYPNLNGTADGSITGGYVYRGSAIPSLYGKYIYGDYVSGRTFVLTYEGVPSASAQLLTDEPNLISAFGVDTSNNIYYCSLGNGRIYKLIGPAADVADNEEKIPARFSLSQNYPNPFNPTTTIEYRLSQTAVVSIEVIDLLGRTIATLVRQERTPGQYSVQWNAKGFSSGLFFVRMTAGIFFETKKILLVQ
ncbi:MAG: PQQ-dependent sugar dehydrogenase [Bacteroidota bacterium]|nr:PQQ-dependent sugar dehydrogenase [Bacteroidota bacterium]